MGPSREPTQDPVHSAATAGTAVPSHHSASVSDSGMEAPPSEPSRDPGLKAVVAIEPFVDVDVDVAVASVVDSMDWVLVASVEHSEDFVDSMGLHLVVV